MKVNFCDHTAETSDSFSSTFRIWDEESGARVLGRRVSGRIWDRCGWASFRIPDDFANGLSGEAGRPAQGGSW